MVRAKASEPRQPVRGRDDDLATIGRHLDQLLSGIGWVILVEGAAGLGKSRLLNEAVTMARRLSIKVGSGAADPGDNVVQLAPVMEALFDGPEPILERAALPGEHTSPEQRYWLLQDLETLLEKAALKAPLLVCVDDLQWADNGTAAALRSLPARLTTVPVGWVIALRPGEGSSQLRSAIDGLEREGAVKIVLRPLGQAGVANKASQIPATTREAEAMSNALKSRGFKFVGPTICYAFMQAAGLVNDHITDCFRYAQLANAGLPRRPGLGKVQI